MLGTDVGDERFDDRLEDPSEEGRANAAGVHRDALDELGRPSTSRSLASTAARWTSWKRSRTGRSADIEQRIDLLQRRQPFLGPLSMLGGDRLPAASGHARAQLERYEARLRAVPTYLRACAVIAEEGVAAGITSPRWSCERTVHQLERLLALPIDGIAGPDAGSRGSFRRSRARRRVGARGREPRARGLPRSPARLPSPRDGGDRGVCPPGRGRALRVADPGLDQHVARSARRSTSWAWNGSRRSRTNGATSQPDSGTLVDRPRPSRRTTPRATTPPPHPRRSSRWRRTRSPEAGTRPPIGSV